MSVIDSLSDTTDKATDIGEEYLDTSREYFKLKLFKQVSYGLSLVSKIVIYGILFLLVITFIAIALAIYIGNHLGSLALGYLIVGGIFLILSIIAVLLSSYIDRTIIKKLSAKFYQ